MRTLLIAILFVFLALPLVGCDNNTRTDDPPRESQAEAEESAEESAPAQEHPALRDPSQANETAPENYRILFETTAGEFTIEVDRSWAPNGADRLYNLVKIGYYDDVAFFRVIDGFMAQFGIHGDPEVAAVWRDANISDDPVSQSNARGTLSFATRGENTRTTQLFINLVDNARLDGMGFSPVGRVVEGMETVDSLYSGYGEGAPQGRGPDQGRIQFEGNDYLRSNFERLDYTTRVSIVED